MDSEELLAAVDAAFEIVWADTPPWPDPHADPHPELCPYPMRAPVAEEEYSRCLDPAKYRILKARVDAWISALTSLGIATVEPVDEPCAAWRPGAPGDSFEHGVWLRPKASDAVPLLFGFRTSDGVPDTVLVIGAGHPAALVEVLPECGCDACDGGSGYLLRELDEAVANVVRGTLVYVITEEGHVVSSPSGWSAQGLQDRREFESGLRRVMEELRRRGEDVRVDPRLRFAARYERDTDPSEASEILPDATSLRVTTLLEEARAGVSPHDVIIGSSWF